MIKRIVLSISMLLVSLSCIAPNLSAISVSEFHNRLVIEWNKVLYDREFNRFINHLGYKESGNDWKIINSIGCIGEYQFAYKTLKHLGYSHITPKRFKQDPGIFPLELQQKVLKQLIYVNTVDLMPYEEYIGVTIKNNVITKAGLIAASHLGGIGSVRLYLSSFGVVDKKDIYGTKISDYIREFSLYNL
jgi:hypothetical protein